MRNPSGNILTGFVTALNSIVYETNTIPVYTQPPLSAPNFYIQLGNVTETTKGCKDTFGYTGTLDVQIICQYSGGYSTPIDAEAITELITETLKPTPTSTPTIPNFKMVWMTLDSTLNDGGLFETNKTYRRILNWRFEIDEN